MQVTTHLMTFSGCCGRSDVTIQESDEVEPGVIVGYDFDGNVVGIEVLNALNKISGINLKQLDRSLS